MECSLGVDLKRKRRNVAFNAKNRVYPHLHGAVSACKVKRMDQKSQKKWTSIGMKKMDPTKMKKTDRKSCKKNSLLNNGNYG